MKTLEEFVRLFAEQFAETNLEAFSGDKNFREIDEWSSVIALSVIAMVDEEFDVILKGDDIKRAKTIADIYDAILAKL